MAQRGSLHLDFSSTRDNPAIIIHHNFFCWLLPPFTLRKAGECSSQPTSAKENSLKRNHSPPHHPLPPLYPFAMSFSPPASDTTPPHIFQATISSTPNYTPKYLQQKIWCLRWQMFALTFNAGGFQKLLLCSLIFPAPWCLSPAPVYCHLAERNGGR